jgi:hypothetical protein
MLTEPTAVRIAKALEVGRKVVGKGRGQREVKHFMTTLDNLERHGHLPRGVRSGFDEYCVALVTSQHVNAGDDGPSTAHLISCAYDGMPLNHSYGPRDIPQHVLEAQAICAAIQKSIPAEMWDVVEQLVGEETGHLQGRPPSLRKHGQRFGWNQGTHDDQQAKQAAAAGGMHAIDACIVIGHAMLAVRRKPKR